MSHVMKRSFAGKMLESIFIAFLPPAFLFPSLGFSNTDADNHAQWHTLTPTYRIGHVRCHMNLMAPTQTCWNSHQIREQQLSQAHALPHAVSFLLKISHTHKPSSHTNTVCPWHELYNYWQAATVCVCVRSLPQVSDAAEGRFKY